jgi:NCAIR mutase (PurE)-related protein
MTRERMIDLLERVRGGLLELEDAATELDDLTLGQLGYATVDLHRERRQGAPEVIYGAGKSPEQIAGIARRLIDAGQNVLCTRAPDGAFEAVHKIAEDAEHHEQARAITIVRKDPEPMGRAALVSAGTSDLDVAEEAAVSCAFFGVEVERVYDVGVAGIHRILRASEALARADVVIVCAGMDGALPSVVGGLVDRPVIAVPTSVGYGAAFGGVSALLAMLNSCASGVTVVNIDNGFGAARAAHRITRAIHASRDDGSGGA